MLGRQVAQAPVPSASTPCSEQAQATRGCCQGLKQDPKAEQELAVLCVGWEAWGQKNQCGWSSGSLLHMHHAIR